MLIPRYKKIRFKDGHVRMSLKELNTWMKNNIPKGSKNISIQLGETFDSRFKSFVVSLEAYWEEVK